ncbi:unnamed protein product [Rotaria sp. Silwood1]|nr:unnamed protein product [Rotaria sp. Silwood1]CAF1592134.1 unnamed protein product [Rotaria sp. Silwood1]
MFLSRISRFGTIFCFNARRIKSSSLCVDSAFIRRFQFCFKTVLAFIISGFIAYGTRLRYQLDQQYIICVISVISIQETVGLTLYSNIQTIISIVPLSIILFIIHMIGLSYGQYLAAELLLLLLSFLIAYQCTQIQTRKIALLYNIIFFSTIANEKKLPILFVFLLLEVFLIGISISIAVSLLVFPLFATIDIENRFNFCLRYFQRMYYLIIQAFLSPDPMAAKVSLSRASIIEGIIRQTLIVIQTRLVEAKYEPSSLIQRIFFRKRKHMIDLNIQEQANLLSSLMFHVSSLQLMVNKCQFNEYHHTLRCELESSLIYLNSCQSSLISSFTSTLSVSKDRFIYRLTNLHASVDFVRSSYKKIRLNQMKNILQSDDHLSHAFFLFQLFTIVKLLIESTSDYSKKDILKEKKTSCLNLCFQFQWSRILLSIKSMIIIGVGSIFVMVPYLAKIFENGQWILIALCMTQADTVGGALTMMNMRLIGTLLGAMWSYITYLLVRDNIFETFVMLIPWIFLFGYLRLFPKWGYTAAVALLTPILINLGRLPYGDALPAGNYALLRIEENFVGIAIASVLTLIIFPVFAIDLLKENIQKSFDSCKDSINSMHKLYDELFHHQHMENEISIDFENINEIKSFLDEQRYHFHQLISSQRMLVTTVSMEPTFCWFKNPFSSSHYNLIVQQQMDIFRMLHNIDVALICLSECAIKNEKELEGVKFHAANGLFLPNVHNELFYISKQLNDCLQLWSTYFNVTQTCCHQLTRGLIPHRTKLNQQDLFEYEKYLSQLHKTIDRLENEHQQGINRLFDHYFQRFNQGEQSIPFVPFAQNEHADSILLALSAMYYSSTQLAHAALGLGTTVREVFELETTNLYQSF